MRRNILGVEIDDISKEEVLEKVITWLSGHPGESRDPYRFRVKPKMTRLIFTPGPEFILTAQKDKEFKEILNKADLSISDSFGLQLYCGFRNRVPGVDLMMVLCQLAAKNKWTIGLIGGPNTKLAAIKLKDKFPEIKIIFAYDDPDPVSSITKPIDILFVGLGHPKQEKFLANSKFEIRNSKFRVGMGVGGSFDLISGVYPRAPEVIRLIGFEWLWRMFTKPGHIRRALRASILFPLAIFLGRGSRVNNIDG